MPSTRRRARSTNDAFVSSASSSARAKRSRARSTSMVRSASPAQYQTYAACGLGAVADLGEQLRREVDARSDRRRSPRASSSVLATIRRWAGSSAAAVDRAAVPRRPPRRGDPRTARSCRGSSPPPPAQSPPRPLANAPRACAAHAGLARRRRPSTPRTRRPPTPAAPAGCGRRVGRGHPLRPRQHVGTQAHEPVVEAAAATRRPASSTSPWSSSQPSAARSSGIAASISASHRVVGLEQPPIGALDPLDLSGGHGARRRSVRAAVRSELLGTERAQRLEQDVPAIRRPHDERALDELFQRGGDRARRSSPQTAAASATVKDPANTDRSANVRCSGSSSSPNDHDTAARSEPCRDDVR